MKLYDAHLIAALMAASLSGCFGDKASEIVTEKKEEVIIEQVQESALKNDGPLEIDKAREIFNKLPARKEAKTAYSVKSMTDQSFTWAKVQQKAKAQTQSAEAEVPSLATETVAAPSFGLIGDADDLWDGLCPSSVDCNLNSEYDKISDAVVPVTDTETEDQVSSSFDPNEPDPDDICWADGSGGSNGGGSGGSSSNSSSELTKEIIEIADRWQVIGREANLEVFVVEAEAVELDVSITTEQWDELQGRILAAQTELFHVYLTMFKSEADPAVRCRYVKKAEQMMQEINLNPNTVASTHSALKTSFDTLSQEFRDAVTLGAVCGEEGSTGTAETLGLIDSYVKNTLESRVIEELDELQVFVTAQLEVLKSLKDRMEVEINTAGVLELRRDVANMNSNLQMVGGPSGEAALDGTMADAFSLGSKMGTQTYNNDVGGALNTQTAEVNGQTVVTGQSWDLQSFDVATYMTEQKSWQESGADKNCENYDLATAPLVHKIACLETILQGGSHPDLITLASRINTLRTDTNSYLSQFVELADDAGLTAGDQVVTACSNLKSFMSARSAHPEDPSANTPITTSVTNPFPDEVLTLLTNNGIVWEGKSDNAIRAAILATIKDNYDQCLVGIESAISDSKTDTELYTTAITAFTDHLEQYSQKLLELKQWKIDPANQGGS